MTTILLSPAGAGQSIRNLLSAVSAFIFSNVTTMAVISAGVSFVGLITGTDFLLYAGGLMALLSLRVSDSAAPESEN